MSFFVTGVLITAIEFENNLQMFMKPTRRLLWSYIW